ncbi:MAG: GTPase ObgE [Proteobacteria bacterium]|nr:MAG: GTPase ObgE [Pseudomonadota bacterium]
MKFIDEAQIEVIAGHGGAGSVHFRRETMEPWGGPDGGDGGRGGSVYIVALPTLTTLMDFRFKKKYKAPNGDNGSGKGKAGRAGADITLRLPVGTIIRDTVTGEVLYEFVKPTVEPFMLVKGGRGGKGNMHFATSVHQAPKFAQPGEEGETISISLELKLLADVGLVGFPNVGKSSLIAAVSAARPKIADYAFTTLQPNLGVVRIDEDRTFVMADVPGLIEGAHEGIGLGIQFLKHLERTRVFIHMIDAAITTRDPEEDYNIVRQELGAFNPELLKRKEIIVFNKIDAAQDDTEKLDAFCAKLEAQGKIFRKVSVAGHDGIPELVALVADVLFTNKYDFVEKRA